jgi:tetratricopeptide (TPR) repeat protein
MSTYATRWPLTGVALAVMLMSTGCISTREAGQAMNPGAPTAPSASSSSVSDAKRLAASVAVQPLYDEARRLIALQQWVAAMQSLDRLLTIEPTHVEALNARASLRAQYGDLAGAQADLRAAIDLDASRAHLHFNMGLVHQMRAEPSAARRAFERAVELDSGHERARLALASMAVDVPVGLPSISTTTAAPPSPVVSVPSQAVSEPAASASASAPEHDSVIRVVNGDAAAVNDPGRVRLEPAQASQGTARNDVVIVRAEPPTQASAGSQDSAADASLLEARVAIANGNGVAGLARALKVQLAQLGPYSTTARNWVNFEQRETRVFHRPGFGLVAVRVSQALPVEAPTAILNPALMGDRDVLVVLGQDIKALGTVRTKSANPAASAPVAGASLMSERAMSIEATGVSKL